MNRIVQLGAMTASVLALTAAHATTLKCVPQRAHHVHHVRTATAPEGIGVMIDEARMITFDRPAKTIYVANPAIADINLIDSQHVFVLGKTFGLTNLIALDTDGKEIENKQLTVVNQQAAITLNRGSDQYNFSCTRAHCETAPRPGDPKSFVEVTEGTVASHQNLAAKNAVSSNPGQSEGTPTN